MRKPFYKRVAFPDALNYFFLVVLLGSINLVQATVLWIQFGYDELPCPLCLLQRIAFFGAGFGVILSLKSRYSPAHTGITLLSLLYLLAVSVRQCMNHIIAGQGGWIGGPVWGVHLTVWSVILALVLFFILSLQLIAVTISGVVYRQIPVAHFPRIQYFGLLMAWGLVLLCGLNLAAVLIQCGAGICHTYRYVLLS